MAAGDFHTLQAALFLPPESLGEVRRRAISRTPIPALPGGLLSENEAGQLALCPWPPLKEWECCLKLSKNRGRHRFGRHRFGRHRFSRHRFGRLACPESLLLHLKGKPFGRPPWPTSLRASGYPESAVNRSGRHVMGLSEFPDTLLLVVLHFGGHLGDRNICGEISLIRGHCRRFSDFAF